MKKFDDNFFEKVSFSQDDFNSLFEAALRDLKIAKEVNFQEVRFTYSYQALLKLGIAVIAKVGGVRIKSTLGHHIKVIEKLAEILENEDILLIGNKMRLMRNAELYSGGKSFSKKEAEEYYKFVASIFETANSNLDLEYLL